MKNENIQVENKYSFSRLTLRVDVNRPLNQDGSYPAIPNLSGFLSPRGKRGLSHVPANLIP